ncbi:hypothetical protein F444_20555 [Phytophthora nicotianae P1976]|uniref:Uncharacterized protein n=1 Tax=Phytophthora nicotianae P1976 TaxID=1317066 RepID=A0A080Z477_PHYNI|nr:hypothetical protein F444_20555 [Phytophthora nicotianae P1976]
MRAAFRESSHPRSQFSENAVAICSVEVAPGYYGSSTGIILDDDKDNSVWTPPRLNYLAENQDGDLSMTDNEKDLLGVASCCISR